MLIAQRFEALSGANYDGPESIRQAALEIEGLLVAEDALSGIDPTDQLSPDVIQATNAIYERYETDLEVDFADQFLEGGVTAEDYPLYSRFHRLVSKEVKLAAIGSQERVLFVGSGPFPISPILIHKLSGGAPVDCFDLSEEACSVSRRVLEKLGYTGIRVNNMKAEEAKLPGISSSGDMGDYDALFVALLAQPKPEILHKIWRSAGPQPRIVLRNSEGNRRLIYTGMDPDLIDTSRFNMIGAYHAGIDDTVSGSVLASNRQPSLFRI